MIDYTVEEFISYLNNTYGLDDWPRFLEVSLLTYDRVFEYVSKRVKHPRFGLNNGLMFKGIELIPTEK